MDVTATVAELVGNDPRVRDVRLGGSRAAGDAHELSDWDFVVETDDFGSLAEDLPALVAPLRPLAQQWDPYSPHACYMLILAGPTKVDLIFPDEPREWSPAWRPSAETLVAIDRHFWDWILWLTQKRSGGRHGVVGSSLGDLFELMLRPMGAESPPGFVADAIDVYRLLRARLERRFGVDVPRELQEEILPAVLSRVTRPG